MNTTPGFHMPVKILIAEDSPTQAEYLKSILETHRCQVRVARNGREALAVLAQEKPTLLISDITMPEMDGYELCRCIRQDQRLADLPVILLTALSDPEDVFKGLECGADNFITKPYEQENLLARIHYLLANVHLHRQEKVQTSMEVYLAGQKHVITSDRAQILNLLLSTYEAAVQKNRELLRARDELTKLNEQLEEKVVERTFSLEEEVAERKRAEAEVRKLNEELEDRVRLRTTELESANRELEAFSYSVSHDLRAPLRAIDGFSNLLQEEFSAKMSEESKRLLGVISSNAHRMGQLIEDLLRFSRLSRQALARNPVKLTALVNDVLEELRKEEAGRVLEIQVEDLPDAVGDFALLKQVWINLISNALKYTRHQKKAVITIGSQRQKGEVVYFIRDNGAGFDMQYADKLFGVFQRLHKLEDFEGTGVGLSIVQRIIYRHGGRIWAEAKVQEGATFYFTLPG
jgi:signal transduction histidine kinase